jgi:hypothetical protein
MKSSRRAATWSAAFALIIALAGCGGDKNRAAVEGNVTLDGVAVAEGRITFYPAEGNSGPTAGAVILNGRYSIPASAGVWVGKNRVEIHGNRKSGEVKEGPSAYPRPGKEKGEMMEFMEEAIPAIYNERSQLIHDVPPGKSVLDFELRSR